MCGRFTLRTNPHTVATLFDLDADPDLEPRTNICPTQPIAVVRVDEAGKRSCDLLRWGLIPRWSKDPKPAGLINARAETVTEKPTFREAFKQRRCLIPADGFYEWETIGKKKQPYRFGLKTGELFAFAGLWETWRGPDSQITSCTILTTAANELLQAIHDRMPVIVPPELYADWLQLRPPEAEQLLQRLPSYPAEAMERTAVDKL